VPEVVRKLGVTEQTYYQWKREYGGLRTDQAKRLKNLEKESARLKRLLAETFRGRLSDGHTAFGAAGPGCHPIDHPSPVTRLLRCR
jgi:hypothetical protein